MLYKLPALMKHERIHQIAGRHAKFSLREREREREREIEREREREREINIQSPITILP